MIVHREENSPFLDVTYTLGDQRYRITKSEKKGIHEIDGSVPYTNLSVSRSNISNKDYITRYKTKDSQDRKVVDFDNMQVTQTLSITSDITEVYVGAYNPAGPDLELSFTPDSDPERIKTLKQMFEVKSWRKT